MEIEDYIEKIVDNGRVEDMKALSDILEDTMEEIEKYDKKCYDKYVMELYKMAYGKKLPDKLKIKWVNNMNPAARWGIEEIKDIYSRYEVNIPLYSFFVIINLLYSDMVNSLGRINNEDDLTRYIQAANDWYYDEDAYNTEEAKLFAYWEYIVN